MMPVLLPKALAIRTPALRACATDPSNAIDPALAPAWERAEVSAANAGRGDSHFPLTIAADGLENAQFHRPSAIGGPLSPDSLSLVSTLPHVEGRATSRLRTSPCCRRIDSTALFPAVLLFVLAAATIAAGEAQGLSLAIAQPTQSDSITTTGRVVAVRSARVGARLSAHIVTWGKTENGQPLDVGCPVQAGQLLFSLQSDTFADRVHVAEVALKLTEAQLADLKAWTREERRESLRATLQEVDARMAERKRDEERFRRLVQEDKTMPVKRLEEIQLQVQVLEAQRRGAQAQLTEAERGPTATQLAVAQAQVAQAQAHLDTARLDLRDTEVKAPFAGVISRRFKSVGDYVTNAPFIEVLEITSQEELEAELRLPEKFYRRIVPGQTSVVLRSPLLSVELTLPVTRVIPEIDPVQSTFTFRLAIPPTSRGPLAPGAFLMGFIALSGTSESAVVPAGAVVTRDGRAVVFVAQDGKMQKRDVDAGDRLSEGVVIDRGVKPGERVIVGPDRELQDGRDLPAHLATEFKPTDERAAP